MSKKSDERPFQIGPYYLSQRPNSPQWCRTYFDADTRQTRRVSLGTADFEAAKEALAAWYTLHGRRDREEPCSVVLATVCARYHEKQGQHVRSAGIQRRNLTIILEASSPGITVGEFTLERQMEVVRKLRGQGYADGTIKRAMGAVKAAVNFAWKNGELDRPIPFGTLPEGQPRERVLSIEELAALWDATEPPHLQMFVMLLLGTAARPEAILQLTRFQCDTARGIIDLNRPGRSQTKKRRPVVPMPDFLVPWIETANSHLVQWKGKPIQKINKTWRTIRDDAGLSDDVVPYSIRHTVATELRSRGVPELEIAGMLGHAMPNFRTTGRYAKYAPDYLGKAREALDDLADEIGRLASRPITPVTVRASSVRADAVPVMGNVAKSVVFLRKTGAGEGIRTLDPNLGKVVLYP